MKLRNFTAGVLALAGAALLSPTAKADLTFNTGDLLLGFRLGGVSPGTEGYVVNIGSFTQFTKTANFTLSLGNIGADLVDIFGADWNTNPDLYWSIIGTSSDGVTSPVIYTTRERTDVNTASTLWKGKSPSTQTGWVSTIQIAIAGYTNDGISTVSTNSSVAATQTASNTSSYAYQTAKSLDFNVWTTIDGSFKNGTAGSVLDLQQINPVNNQNAVFLGSFSLDDNGELSYIGAQAVPEPSTYVMAIGGVALLTVLRRRKAIAAA